jgi:hypothetical protein
MSMGKKDAPAAGSFAACPKEEQAVVGMHLHALLALGRVG